MITSSTIFKNFIEMREGSTGTTTFDCLWKCMESQATMYLLICFASTKGVFNVQGV